MDSKGPVIAHLKYYMYSCFITMMCNFDNGLRCCIMCLSLRIFGSCLWMAFWFDNLNMFGYKGFLLHTGYM